MGSHLVEPWLAHDGVEEGSCVRDIISGVALDDALIGHEAISPACVNRNDKCLTSDMFKQMSGHMQCSKTWDDISVLCFSSVEVCSRFEACLCSKAFVSNGRSVLLTS